MDGGGPLSIATAAHQNHFSHQRDRSSYRGGRTSLTPPRRMHRVPNKPSYLGDGIMRMSLCLFGLLASHTAVVGEKVNTFVSWFYVNWH